MAHTRSESCNFRRGAEETLKLVLGNQKDDWWRQATIGNTAEVVQLHRQNASERRKGQSKGRNSQGKVADKSLESRLDEISGAGEYLFLCSMRELCSFSLFLPSKFRFVFAMKRNLEKESNSRVEQRKRYSLAPEISSSPDSKLLSGTVSGQYSSFKSHLTF